MKRALFLCTGNSCRSQMAEVLLNHLGRGKWLAFSAGSRPAGYVHPLALRVLQDAQLPVKGLRSKSWDEFLGQPIDMVVTVCGRAKETCPVWPGHPVTAHWGFEDPAEAVGSEEQKLQVFHKVFKEIQARIELFLRRPVDQLSQQELQTHIRTLASEE